MGKSLLGLVGFWGVLSLAAWANADSKVDANFDANNKIAKEDLGFSNVKFASTEAKAQYCAQTADDFSEKALSTDQRIDFANQGGLLNGGVCWWHSRLQRNAYYLAIFDPTLPKPSAYEAQQILYSLVNERGPVVVPGYTNFSTFTREYQELVQNMLTVWQVEDGFLRFAWVRGLKGDNSRPAVEMYQEMKSVYNKIHNLKDMVFIKLQLPGIVSHSWLMIDMEKTDRGFKYKYIDSNFPWMTMEDEYREGDTTVYVSGFGPAGFYQSYQGTMDNLRKQYRKFCGHSVYRTR